MKLLESLRKRLKHLPDHQQWVFMYLSFWFSQAFIHQVILKNSTIGSLQYRIIGNETKNISTKTKINKL